MSVGIRTVQIIFGRRDAHWRKKVLSIFELAYAFRLRQEPCFGWRAGNDVSPVQVDPGLDRHRAVTHVAGVAGTNTTC